MRLTRRVICVYLGLLKKLKITIKESTQCIFMCVNANLFKRILSKALHLFESPLRRGGLFLLFQQPLFKLKIDTICFAELLFNIAVLYTHLL